MHCDHCVRRYERESVAVEAVCIVSLNYGHCDTATRNCATEWSLRVTATQLLKKRRHGKLIIEQILIINWEYNILLTFVKVCFFVRYLYCHRGGGATAAGVFKYVAAWRRCGEAFSSGGVAAERHRFSWKPMWRCSTADSFSWNHSGAAAAHFQPRWTSLLHNYKS